MSRRVAILQSNYIPWRGYFDIMGLADEFVLYDVVQFTKNDWRNRNRIKTANGVQWLTIPVATSGRFGQTIADTRIVGSQWAVKHWASLSQSYAKAPHFETYRDRLADAYRQCSALVSLSGVNRTFIEVIASALGLSTRISNAADYGVEGDRNARLVAICRALNANVYVSGPAAKDYLDVALFGESGITVEFMDYSSYPDYPQLHGAFEPFLSILDLILNVGPSATSYMHCGRLRGEIPGPRPSADGHERSPDRQ